MNDTTTTPMPVEAFSRELALRLVPRNIKRGRAATGISQADLGDRTGVRANTISQLEAGRFLPSVDLAIRIANHINVPTHDLIDPLDIAPIFHALGAVEPTLTERVTAVHEAHRRYLELVANGATDTDAIDLIAGAPDAAGEGAAA